MTHVPAAFRARIAAHNSNALVMAMVSLGASVMLWAAAYFFFVAILLALDVAATGAWDEAPPEWIRWASMVCAALLLLWGVVDCWIHRYREVDDRPIIGWHLVREFLLMPVRVTFAIWGNLGAIRFPDRHLQSVAWQILDALIDRGSAPATRLPTLVSGCQYPERACDLLLHLGLIEIRLVGNRWIVYPAASTLSIQQN